MYPVPRVLTTLEHPLVSPALLYSVTFSIMAKHPLRWVILGLLTRVFIKPKHALFVIPYCSRSLPANHPLQFVLYTQAVCVLNNHSHPCLPYLLFFNVSLPPNLNTYWSVLAAQSLVLTYPLSCPVYSLLPLSPALPTRFRLSLLSPFVLGIVQTFPPSSTLGHSDT